MKRMTCAPRFEWERRAEERGLLFHTNEVPIYGKQNGSYRSAPEVVGTEVERHGWWGEGTYYELSAAEVDRLENATTELNTMIDHAVQYALDNEMREEMGVDERLWEMAIVARKERHPSIYSRLDLVFTSDGGLKLLEVNGETPTSLLESAVIQWDWLEDLRADLPDGVDQFNSIHEKLVKWWKFIRMRHATNHLHFAALDSLEDRVTIAYLAETAQQAGITPTLMDMGAIGWSADRKVFTDLDEEPIARLFKLYPWTWLMQDTFAANLSPTNPTIIEPAWKAISSSKGILPLLWRLNHDHPFLLSAHSIKDPDEPLFPGWVRKPMHGREGQNVSVWKEGEKMETIGGPCADGPFVEQKYADIQTHDGMRPIIGSWIIGGEPAGIGIRESRGFVTDSTATFVPHLFV